MIVSASTRPSASSRDQPKVVSAAGFQSVITPCASIPTNASWALSSADRARVSGSVGPRSGGSVEGED